MKGLKKKKIEYGQKQNEVAELTRHLAVSGVFPTIKRIAEDKIK